MPTHPTQIDRSTAVAMFFTSVGIHGVAKALGCRKGRVRDIWVEEFGEEAVVARKNRLLTEKRTGSNNPMFGRTGESAPMYGKTGELNPLYGKRGKDCHNYKEDAKLGIGNGYVMARVPDWWEGTIRQGRYVLEHHLVYAEANALSKIPEGMVVHHVNGVKDDNRLENLELMEKSSHSRMHALRQHAQNG